MTRTSMTLGRYRGTAQLSQQLKQRPERVFYVPDRHISIGSFTSDSKASGRIHLAGRVEFTLSSWTMGSFIYGSDLGGMDRAKAGSLTALALSHYKR
jgi:hypothetical protein